MSIVGWVILGIYVFGYIATFRYVTYAMAHYWAVGKEPETGDVVTGFLAAFVTCFVWPIAILFMTGIAEKMFMAEPPKYRKERELREREENIKRLERELGIVKTPERKYYQDEQGRMRRT